MEDSQQRIVQAAQTLDKAITDLYQTMQTIEKREPKVMAGLRKNYALPQTCGKVADAIGALMTELSTYFKSQEN